MQNREQQRGFTIIEMMVAMVVSTIVIGIAYSVFITSFSGTRHKEKERSTHLKVESMWGVVEKRIAQSRGLVHVGESHIYFVDWNDSIQRVDYTDSSMSLNGSPIFEGEIQNLRCAILGKVISNDIDGDSISELDYDANGLIDQIELDLDGSGELEQGELTHARMLKVSFLYGTMGRTYSSLFALRNRVSQKYEVENLNLLYLE